MRASSSARRPHLARLLALGAGGLCLAACLEANSTPAVDGGPAADGSGSQQSSRQGTPDTGTTPHPDATMMGTDGGNGGGDTGSPGSDGGAGHEGGAGHDAGTDAGEAIPICKNPTSTLTACNACTESSCASDVGPALSSCAAFYTCYAGCDCSDQTCLAGCQNMIASGCMGPATSLYNCSMSMCAAACAPPDAGSHDAALVDAGATCKNPTSTQLACGQCEESMCASTVAAEKSACGTFNTCFDACDCSDTSCVDACAEAAPSGCVTQLEALQSCQTGACASACTASSDGGTGDGGAPKGIPDCKNPTAAEKMIYASCSACDDMSCATYVTAAVAACSAYYACFGSTACSNTATCDGDLTANCSTAIDALATCQDSLCFLECE